MPIRFSDYVHPTHPIMQTNDLVVYLYIRLLDPILHDIRNGVFYNPRCCICFEKHYESKTAFECECCVDGIICRDCFVADKRNVGSKEELSDEDIHRVIQCPVCRVKDWKYLFNIVLSYHFEDMPDFSMWGNCHDDEVVEIIN